MKKKNEDSQFQQQLQMEQESNTHYLQKCIDEVNELCYELKVLYFYEFINEYFVKKYISSKPFRLSPDGKNPFLQSSVTIGLNETSLFEEKDLVLSSKYAKTKMLSVAKFHREHEAILAKFIEHRKGQHTSSPLPHLGTSNLAGPEYSYHSKNMNPSLSTETLELKESTSLLRSTGIVNYENSGEPSTSKSERKRDAGKKINYEDDEYELDSDNESKLGKNQHNSMNELEKRNMIQSIQQKILDDLHEKDFLLLQQIEEIKQRGWNKSLIKN